MNKLLNYKTKTKNATPPIFTEIVALFFFTNCQRWDYNTYVGKWQGFYDTSVLIPGIFCSTNTTRALTPNTTTPNTGTMKIG